MLLRNLDEFSSLFWGSWNSFDRVNGQLNRLLQGTAYECQGQRLLVNIWNADEGAVVTAQMTGLKPESIQVNLDGRTLIVSCEREGRNENFHRLVHQEIDDGKFLRAIELDFEPDADAIRARYQDGQIEIHIPMAESAKPKQIEIQAGN